MRIDLLEAFGLEPQIINLLKSQYSEELLPIQVRAVKEVLMMNRLISPAAIKEIENSYEVFSCAIKRAAGDFSWLSEALAKEIRWDLLAVAGMKDLSRRLTCSVTEHGLPPANVYIRRLGRRYISRLIAEGFDASAAGTDLPLTDLEKLLSKHLASWLYSHIHREYQQQKDSAEATASGVCDTGGAQYGGKTARQVKTGAGVKRPVVPTVPSSPASSLSSAPAANAATTITTETTPAASDISFPHHRADILRNRSLLFALRTRLADTHDLRELITDTPAFFIDERQQLFFYRGIPIKLQPVCFHYLLLLAEKPKQIVTRDEIYHRLWPGPMNYDGSNKPYDRQISDHKRRCVAQIKKSITGKIEMALGELEALIITRPKVGYMLNLRQEEVLLLKAQ
jgi:DNA-binding winged helix-turn-helix (wHTH) protein